MANKSPEKNESVACYKCHQIVSKSDLDWHVREELIYYAFRCYLCGHRFLTEELLTNVHLLLRHPDKPIQVLQDIQVEKEKLLVETIKYSLYPLLILKNQSNKNGSECLSEVKEEEINRSIFLTRSSLPIPQRGGAKSETPEHTEQSQYLQAHTESPGIQYVQFNPQLVKEEPADEEVEAPPLNESETRKIELPDQSIDNSARDGEGSPKKKRQILDSSDDSNPDSFNKTPIRHPIINEKKISQSAPERMLKKQIKEESESEEEFVVPPRNRRFARKTAPKSPEKSPKRKTPVRRPRTQNRKPTSRSRKQNDPSKC